MDTRRARLRMAAAFVVSAGVVLVVLGVLLFALLVRERSIELTRELRGATDETIRAAAVIAPQQTDANAIASAAVDEISSPDIALYLFDNGLHRVGGSVAPREVVAVARRAQTKDVARQNFTNNHQNWRAVAQAFTVRNQPFVVVAVADESKLDEHYVRLMNLFTIAALLGVLLLGVSSYYFTGRAIRPIEASAEAVRRFMTDAAHELRTPVAAVRTQAEVALKGGDLNAAAIEPLRTIVSESERLSGLVNDLLTLARADVGERVIKREPFYLDDVASDALASVSALARTNGITLSQRRYEQARIVGDVRLVRQLLSILLDNALKYTPAGGTVSMDVYETEMHAVVAVEDTGIGIKDVELPHVFERFFRGERARETTSGAGLGLSIAQWIASTHSASIVATSTAAGGACFEVRFPKAS